LQPVDIKSRWRHNWKLAQVVNSHLLCDPTIRQPGFDLLRQRWPLLNRFRTEQRHCGMPAEGTAEGNGDIQTLTCVLVVRPKQCSTLSNPVPWQNWMAAYLGYTLRIKMLFRGWPVMIHDTRTRRKRKQHSTNKQANDIADILCIHTLCREREAKSTHDAHAKKDCYQ